MSERNDRDEPALPGTRSLPELIAALDVTITELRFQAYRLREHVEPRTAEEERFHAVLREKYIAAEKTVKQLMRYHEKRLARLEERGTLEQMPFDQAGAIDAGGRAMAFTEDEDAPV